MGNVIAYGYLGVTAPDLDEFRTFATELLGMQVDSSSTDKRLNLRMDERAWRISVEEGPGGLNYCGWETANAESLEELREHLEANGIAVKEDQELAKERMVSGLLACEDPAGNRIEFFHGAFIPKSPFVSSIEARFVTGEKTPGDMGFGHTVLMVPDVVATKRFYMDLLGFRLSDTISLGEMGLGVATFTHVNPRHHSLAFAEVPGIPGSMLNHFMLEVEDLDMVGRALEKVIDGKAPLATTLGKHTNDRMVSFYMQSPGGFNVEYGCYGRHIDDSVWTTSSYDAISFWGHRPVVPANA